MCINIYIYTYRDTYKYTYLYIHTYMHARMHAYIHTYTYMHTYVHISTYLSTYLSVRTWTLRLLREAAGEPLSPASDGSVRAFYSRRAGAGVQKSYSSHRSHGQNSLLGEGEGALAGYAERDGPKCQA